MPRAPDGKEVKILSVTEQEMVCYNCIYRGEPHKYASGKCLIYSFKPFNVLGGDRTADCPAFEKDPDVDVE